MIPPSVQNNQYYYNNTRTDKDLESPFIDSAMDALSISKIAVFLIFVVSLIVYRRNRPAAILKRPPGPPGIPILGNVLQIPTEHLATRFREFLRDYGGLVYLNLAGIPVLLIGDAKTAENIMDKHSAKFSSRPSIYYIDHYLDPIGAYWAFHPPTEVFRIGRRLTAGLMSSVRAGQTEPLHQFETLLTVQHLLREGSHWQSHLSRLVGSTVLSAAYGQGCPNGDEPELIEAAFIASEIVALCNLPASIINFFPILDWIPGPMPWRTRMKAFHKREGAFFQKLIHEAVSGKHAGMNTWAAEFAREDRPEGNQSRSIYQFTSAAFKTTKTTIETFILACVLYPEWVVKAQKELDEVVGPDRVPKFADRGRMPYVEAVLRESLRWRPAGRSGVPHMSTEDDIVEHNGEKYFIPAGTTVFAVSWAIDHNPQDYKDPDRFDPERYLDESGELKDDYKTSAFGYGRRSCPGSPFAERIVWMAIAMLLWTFNIRKSKEPDPKTGLPFEYDASDAGFYGDLENAPKEFPAVFTPRSRQHEAVARQEWEACEKDLNVLLPASKKT